MKKLLTLIIAVSAMQLWAQGPEIRGTYLPVRGTAIQEIWDITSTNITVPDTGQNKIWDYSAEFTHPTAPYVIRTFNPDTSHYYSSFPDATHASYLTAPFNDITDSLYSYYIVDTDGLYMIGGKSEKSVPSVGSTPLVYVGNNDTIRINPKELYAPSYIAYGLNVINTSKTETSGGILNPSSPPIHFNLRRHKIKNFNGVGYGTLVMPNGYVYDNVLLAKTMITTLDSAFNTINGGFMPVSGYSPGRDTVYEYSFLRNNTFGSTVLMYLHVNSSDNQVTHGWYTLPVDFGFIAGTVYTDSTENNVVTHGEALLYRANSNFTPHDILDRVWLDTAGHYQFDSIPFGTYRVAIRADTSYYHRAITTYFGDKSDWLLANTIVTFGDSTADGNDIHLQYYPDSAGTNFIQGSLHWNSLIRSSDPIKGITFPAFRTNTTDVIREATTDSVGVFTIGDLPDGEYTLFVDIPGCMHASTYDFCVYGGQVLTALDYQCGRDSLHALNAININGCSTTSVIDSKGNDKGEVITVYPNPYSESTRINVNLSNAGNVALEVYNLLGERVQVLENGNKNAGTYSYTFSAQAINRSAGVYFVRLMANGKTSVLKIVEQ